MTSLHRKISLAFAASASLTAVLVTLAFLDLLFLENRIEQQQTVNNLETTIQDMRREEKNLFLYQDITAGQAANQLAAQANMLLTDTPEALKNAANSLQIKELSTALSSYRALLATYVPLATDDQTLESQIREQGHTASRLIGTLHTNQRALLQETLIHAKWAQVIGVVILGILLLLISRLLVNSVITPMKRLIDDLTPIAEGRFDRLTIESRNAEMITLRKAFNRMLDELETRRRRLIQSEKLAALGVLVSGVAHELNNPLSNISSSSQLLLEELDSADPAILRDWARNIDHETERARRTVDALQDFGRRKEPHTEPVNLSDLIERTLLLLRGQLRKTGALVENHVPLDLTLHADPHRLQQVFINLLRNAADSGEHLTLHIHALCKPSGSTLPAHATVVGELGCNRQKGQNIIEITLTDNGAGIPADILPRIFEPFYTTREPGHGMGLGLYIVQEIIQEHEGCIAITSQPGQGTQVVIRLPYGGAKA